MGDKIGFILLLVVALGIGLYLFSSGALVSAVHTFNAAVSPHATSSAPSTASSTTSTAGGSSFWSIFGPGNGGKTNNPPPTQTGTGQTYISAPPGSPTSSSVGGAATSTINPAEVPAGYVAADLSPYFHKIRFAGVSAGTPSYYGTIRLSYYSYQSTGTIDITGWHIKTRDSGEYIPQAINIYDPTGLTPASDIRMKTGDIVSLYSSSAPFNLRLNECIGYIAHMANFKPALPMTCPYINRSQIQNFTGQCQNYILSIPSCGQPNMTSSQIPRNDYACQDYLENNFTYKSCFAAHAGDANFLSTQVWVWMGANVVDRYHDTVKLLDRNGLLVDLYTY